MKHDPLGSRWSGAILLAALVFPLSSNAQPDLTLEKAEELALASEPGREAMLAKAQVMAEKSVVAGQLPDPQVRLGMGNFPIESGGFSTEGMTQAQLGIRQAFPGGKTRSLGTERFRELGLQLRRSASAREKEVRMQVRQAWLAVYYWQHASAIVIDSRQHFEDLLTVTRSHYSVGHRDQQDLLRAELELSRLDDRLLSINQSLAQARAMLFEWIGSAALQPVGAALPLWHKTQPLETLVGNLSEHPQVLAAQSLVNAQSTGVALAQQQYKPDWAIDLGYGYRDGLLPNGQSRSDFVSVTVTVDMPLFRANRQDRTVAAARQQERAATLDLALLRRQLEVQLRSAYARWEDLARQIELYERTVVPQSEDRAKAASLAYQSDSGNFEDVVRARIDVLDIRLQLERLSVERLQSYAVLDNLGGMTP
ncbi:MAG: TolC family protein [Lysobacterales bacterium]